MWDLSMEDHDTDRKRIVETTHTIMSDIYFGI